MNRELNNPPQAVLAAEMEQVAQLIREKTSFLIVGHLRPDGDCLGSCLGLMQALISMGKQVRFYTLGPVPGYFKYLPDFNRIETTFPTDAFDAVLCVDTSDEERVHPGFKASGTVAVIDHHISNTRFGSINWIDSQASAAAEMVNLLIEALGVTVTAPIATALYTGIMTDTGGFRFGNTRERTFRVASALVSRGADPARIAEWVWDSRSPATIQLAGMVMSSLKYEFGGRLVWNEISQQMIRSVGDDQAEPEGLSSEMRSIRGVDVAILFYETTDGLCRIGFRSRGENNVSELAALMGGGGHKNASGAFIAEPYAQVRQRVLDVAREYLGKMWE